MADENSPFLLRDDEPPYRPTSEDMKDWSGYMKKISRENFNRGFAIIEPCPWWKNLLKPVPDLIKDEIEITVREQHATKIREGLYSVETKNKKELSISEYLKEVQDQPLTKIVPSNFEILENEYWQNLETSQVQFATDLDVQVFRDTVKSQAY